MITIWDWFERYMPIKERYRLIKEAGFDGIMMWWSNEFGRDIFGKDDYRNGPKIAREIGLFIENIHAHVQNANKLWLDNLEGESQGKCYRQCVKDCADFDIPTMVLHLPSEDNLYNPLGLDRMKMIAELAEHHGVNVALENLHNLPSLAYILEQVDSQRIGFCYDSGHHYRYYPDVDLLSKYGTRLMALHLHDNNGSNGQHGLPFDGDIDWDITMKNIVATSYTGATALEPMKWDYENLTVEEFLRVAFDKAKRLELLRS
ncbi:sugar phosphate isomerase/epimerase family protein [Vallitalea maricola]|uniref:Sugar phosphate isomerase/epimerase n=1 Tax=Vallitalea maricola TaxID=3074433 RepID=A0ACB5UPS4_9FIRM|nr:sugar phosphate isomerase/epimerase [Vallitalea sp. AN17-2]